jgi:hypothetical protein
MSKLPKKLIFAPEKVQRFETLAPLPAPFTAPEGDAIISVVRASDYDVLLELYLQAAACIHCGQILGHHSCEGNKCPNPGRDPSQPEGGFDKKETFTLPVVTL